MSKLTLVRPKTTILTLGGNDYPLVYDFNAFAELEENFGSVQEAFEKLSVKTPKMGDILTIIKAGLASSDVEISRKELGSYLTPANMADVMVVLGDAIQLAMPKEEKESKVAKN